jgi:FkbM family methyltransferase
MTLNRKRFLENTASAAAGAVLGAFGHSLLAKSPAAELPRRAPTQAPAVNTTLPPEARPAAATHASGTESFSQAGEDLSVNYILQQLGVSKLTYLDVGANDPIAMSNTYFFYRKGHRGVLVEPNVDLCQKLREVRPRDETLAAGIGVTAAKEADYYLLTYSGLNTFSKEQADRLAQTTKGRVTIKQVIKVPLLDINDVMEEHFQGAPSFLSIDTEGLDLAILKSIDYKRFRPKVICAETLFINSTKVIAEIPEFMASHDYVARGGSMVNTVFVDAKIL